MANNVNAQQWLDKKYPLNGICNRNNDQENKNKRRGDIINLDISQGKLGKSFFQETGDKVLFGSLKLEGFDNLRSLKVTNHQLNKLDLSDCKNLRELECHDNKLTNLNVQGCIDLKILNCSNNNFSEINLSDCSSLNESTIKSDLTYNIEKNKLIKESNMSQITKAQENDIRNILIVGWTGNGKSNLANSLTNSNKFKTGSYGSSVTERFEKSDIFEWQGKKYCIIDNIGFGDTSNLSKEDLLFRVGEGIYSSKEGINQILFVVKGRFSEEQITAFEMFKGLIAESGITKFTTVVRTGFKDFRSAEKCTKDKEDLLTQKKELAEIVNSCNGIIHVDNPAIPELDEDDSDNEEEINIAKKKRKISRERLLNHLAENCSDIYKLKGWDSIYNRVSEYMKKIEDKEEVLKKSNDNSEKNKLQSEIKEEKKKVNAVIEFEAGLNPTPNATLSARVELNNINNWFRR